MQRARAWAQAALREAGCDTVWEEPVTVPRWERGHEWARLTSPYEADLPMLGLGRSAGTPPEGIEAEVLTVRSFEELTARAAEVPGKIVLFAPPWEGYGPNVKYRSQGASEAAKLGAVACLIRPAGFGANTPHTGVMRYENGVPHIPAASLTPEDAGRLRRLCERGKAPRVRLMMEARRLEDGPCANVFGELRGREKPEEIVLIAAHLDAWDVGGGAHDDGAGCVMMVAALKLLHDLGLQPRRTVRVGLFTAEEFGGQGGDAYLEAHREEAAQPRRRPGERRRLLRAGGLLGEGQRGAGRPRRGAGAAAGPAGRGQRRARLGRRRHRPPRRDRRARPRPPHPQRPVLPLPPQPADTFDKVSTDDLAANVAAIAALVLAIADEPQSLRDLAVDTTGALA